MCLSRKSVRGKHLRWLVWVVRLLTEINKPTPAVGVKSTFFVEKTLCYGRSTGLVGLLVGWMEYFMEMRVFLIFFC